MDNRNNKNNRNNRNKMNSKNKMDNRNNNTIKGKTIKIMKNIPTDSSLFFYLCLFPKDLNKLALLICFVL